MGSRGSNSRMGKRASGISIGDGEFIQNSIRAANQVLKDHGYSRYDRLPSLDSSDRAKIIATNLVSGEPVSLDRLSPKTLSGVRNELIHGQLINAKRGASIEVGDKKPAEDFIKWNKAYENALDKVKSANNYGKATRR